MHRGWFIFLISDLFKYIPKQGEFIFSRQSFELCKPHLIYVSVVPAAGGGCLLRNCLDLSVSNNVCDFLIELGAKVGVGVYFLYWNVKVLVRVKLVILRPNTARWCVINLRLFCYKILLTRYNLNVFSVIFSLWLPVLRIFHWWPCSRERHADPSSLPHPFRFF